MSLYGAACRKKVQVLNQDLYDALSEAFDGNVKISKQGQQYRYRHTKWKGRPSISVIDGGENYDVNCPLCGDTRNRCSINHSFGTKIDGINAPPLIHCFNENCEGLVEWFNNFLKEENVERVSLTAVVRKSIPTREEIAAQLSHSGLQYFNPDPVSSLPHDHPAVSYLTSRGFDIDCFAQYFRVGYCDNSGVDAYMARKCIVAFITYGGKRIGWSARAIPGHTPMSIYAPEKPWPYREPKYRNSSGFRKSYFLYNFDQAKEYETMVIAEGITDVWKIGPWGMALFGKTMSEQQCQLLCQAAEAKRAWIVLLGDASTERDDAASSWRRNRDMLLRTYRYPEQVRLFLFEKGDPGDYTSQQLNNLVCDILHRQ